MLTVGLTGLLTLGSAGARPTLSDIDVTLTSVLVSSLFATIIGLALFVQVGLRARRLREQVSRLVILQRVGLGLADKVLKGGDIETLVKETNEWLEDVSSVLKGTFPEYLNTS